MDNRTVRMVAENGVNIDSHYILDGCDNGVRVASSWNRSTHASSRVQTRNAAQPTRSGFDMDSHYTIDSYHYALHRVHRYHLPNAAAIPMRGSGTAYRHISHPPPPPPPPMLYHPHASFTMRRMGFGTGYGHISPPPFPGHQTLLDIGTDNTSYEEFLELAERIGNVSTGLSDEIITAQMKTKDYVVTEDTEDNDCCVICQDEYASQEIVGILRCGHEYHARCLRKWLQMKNVCPMCKSEALSVQ